MRRSIKNHIFGVLALLSGLFVTGCQSELPEIKDFEDNDYLLKEFALSYGNHQYYAAIDHQEQTMSLSNIVFSQLVSSVRYTLAEGATISPIPGEEPWVESQTFTVTLGDESVDYTLTLPDYTDFVDYKSVGYITAAYYDYANKIDQIDWSHLSHVIMSFLQVNADGSIQYSSNTLIDRLNDLKAIAGVNDFKVMIAVQSSSTASKNFYQAINNESSRASLIESLVNFVDDYELAGIDIDYEEYYNIGAAYDTFIKELGVALDKLEQDRGSEVLYSVAVAPNISGYPTDLGSTVDFINIMIYDIGWASLNADHAPVNYFKNVMAESVAKYGADARQLIGGVPFYGYTYDNLGANSSATGSAGTQKAYNEIFTKYVATYSAQYIADSNQVDNTTYDGRGKLAEKCQYVVDNTYGGIMIWQIGQDLTNAYEDYKLLTVVGNTLEYVEGKELK